MGIVVLYPRTLGHALQRWGVAAAAEHLQKWAVVSIAILPLAAFDNDPMLKSAVRLHWFAYNHSTAPYLIRYIYVSASTYALAAHLLMLGQVPVPSLQIIGVSNRCSDSAW